MSRPKTVFDVGAVFQWVVLACVGLYLVVEPSRDGPSFLIALALPFAAVNILLYEARRRP